MHKMRCDNRREDKDQLSGVLHTSLKTAIRCHGLFSITMHCSLLTSSTLNKFRGWWLQLSYLSQNGTQNGTQSSGNL